MKYGQSFRQMYGGGMGGGPFGGAGRFGGGGGMAPPQAGFQMPQQSGFNMPDVMGGVGKVGGWIGDAAGAVGDYFSGDEGRDRLGMVGSVGEGIANYLSERDQNKLYEREIALREQQYADEEKERQRQRDAWSRYGQGG